MFYCFFREGIFKKPVVNVYWVQKFKDLKEDDIWNNTKGTMIDDRHKAIFTDIILTKIGMELSETCKVCNAEDESFLHLFLNCRELEDFN